MNFYLLQLITLVYVKITTKTITKSLFILILIVKMTLENLSNNFNKIILKFIIVKFTI